MSTAISNNNVSDFLSSAQNTPNTAAFAPDKAMDQTDFLRLLTTQLKNQDPNKPMDPTNFVTDLTQMSQLESTNQLNKSVMAMKEGFQSLQTMQASALIGKSVLAEGSDFSHAEGKESKFRLNLDQALSDVTLVVSDGTSAVKEISLGDLAKGEESGVWDGKDENGNPMANGVYKLTAYGTDKNGELQSIKTVVGTQVNSVAINSDGTMKLTLATGETVNMSAVREISE